MAGEKLLEGFISEIFSPLYQLAVAVAFLYFFYGVIRFIIDMNDPTKKNIGKQHLLWGTIGLFIILSVGAIIETMNDIFGGMFSF